MKKIIIGLILFLFACSTAYSQDVIVKKDGSTVLAKVLTVSKEIVEYKKWSNPNGPTYKIEVNELLSINYQNGDIDRFDDKPVQEEKEAPVVNAVVEPEVSTDSKVAPETQEPPRYQDSFSLYSVNKIYLDGNDLHDLATGTKLSDGQLKQILMPSDYSTYILNYDDASIRHKVAGTIAAAVAGAGAVAIGVGIYATVEDGGTAGPVTIVTGSVATILGLLFSISQMHTYRTGVSELESVVNHFNGGKRANKQVSMGFDTTRNGYGFVVRF